PLPADVLAEVAADERREEGTEVDADVEDHEGAIAARIALLVQIADLRRDVRLEEAVADDEEEEARIEEALVHQRELRRGHDDAADEHALALPDQLVGEVTAEHRRQVREAGVEAVDLRRLLLDRHLAEDQREEIHDGVVAD